ncbi:MAG TPA: hypothetical protein VL426_00345 [Candidatus Binatia bacterium]|jgi:hypothetical protein|nr:hypothetical protein [Candidatus Binatia bacterium]
MSDQKATSGDKKADAATKPLEKEKIDVSVTPKQGGDKKQTQDNRQYADKVKKSLENDVKKSLDGAKQDGAKKQLDAAEKTAQDAGKKIDPSKIEKVKVKVEGEAGGEKVKRETVVAPKKES